MIKSEQNQQVLYDLIKKIPLQEHIRMHGSHKLIVPEDWKKGLQINADQHILYVQSGEGVYDFGHHREKLHKGKLIFVSKSCAHRVEHSRQFPLEINGLRFDFYRNETAEAVPLTAEPFYLSWEVPDPLRMGMFFSEIHHAFHDQREKELQRKVAAALTYKILSDLAVRYPTGSAGQDLWEALSKIRQEMDSDVTNRISVCEFAEKLGITERYFRDLFKRKYGVSPKEYQLTVRMNYAKILLENTPRNMKEIAFHLGYSDQYAFSRQFKAFFGKSPSSVENR